MKIEKICFDDWDVAITYYIGQNAKDNFAVIDQGMEDDLWFHAKNVSSCHVVAILPPSEFVLEEKEKRRIIRQGAELCKLHTAKLASLHNVPIMYTEIRNVTKTKTHGLVMTKDSKVIIC